MEYSQTIKESLILRKDFTDTDFTARKAAFIVFMSVMNVLMFLGNILSIVTIISTPRLREKVSYWFVFNLAVIDLLISLTVVPLNIMWEYYGIWPLSLTTCKFFTFADMSFSTISAYSIVLVSVDKYLYITHAIHYYDRMTRKTAIIMIVTVWILAFVLTTWSVITEIGTKEEFRDHFLELSNGTKTCIYLMTDDYVIPSVILCFFVPLAVLCFTSSRIVCIASRHIKKVGAVDQLVLSATQSPVDRNPTEETIGQNTSSASTKTLTDTTDNPTSNSHKEDIHKQNKTESLRLGEETVSQSTINTNTEKSRNQLKCTNSAKSIISQQSNFHRKSTLCNCHVKKLYRYFKLFGTVNIVILCFVIMFAPFNIAIIIDVSCHCVEPWIYEDILAVLYYMHSLVNPYIYMATDKKYKVALKILWKQLKSYTGFTK